MNQKKRDLIIISSIIMLFCVFSFFVAKRYVLRESLVLNNEMEQDEKIVQNNNNDDVVEISLGDTCSKKCGSSYSKIGNYCYKDLDSSATKASECSGYWANNTCYGTRTSAYDWCTSCDAGKYLDNGTCYKCGKGTYSSAGATGCTKCDKGTYNNTEGSATCTKCSAGTYNNEKGSTSCTKCSTGTYQDEEGKTSCKKCEKGEYQDKEGQTWCPMCEWNTYTDKKGQSTCTECKDGNVNDERTKCIPCKVQKVEVVFGSYGKPALVIGQTADYYLRTNGACYEVHIPVSASNATASGASCDETVCNGTVTPANKCGNKAKITASINGSSASASVTIYEDHWTKMCDNCEASVWFDNPDDAEREGAAEYGIGCEGGDEWEPDSTSVCDAIYTRSCSSKFVQRYNYCCVDNELPGLSKNVFWASKELEKNGGAACKKYASKYGKPALDTYTLIEESKISKEKCVEPPEVPGRCSPTNTEPVSKTKSASECESTVNVTIDEGQKCTNTDNKENKSFYKIDCSKNFDTKFDYGDDNSTITSRGLYRGEGFDFGIYIDSRIYCKYRFYESVWKDVYNKFIRKIELIDEGLIPYVKNNDPDGWKNYIDTHWKGKLKEKNVKDLYEFWRIIEELKEVVENYNNYKSSDFIDEGAEITINTKESGKTVKINDFFVRKLLDEGEMKKTNVTKKTLGIKNLKDPEDYDWSNSHKPRKVQLTPKKTCIDTYDGTITILDDENATCSGRNYYSGKKIYVGYNIDEGTYKMELVVSGLGTQDTRVINNKCDITIPTYKLQYRSIDVSNPFINKDWNKGANWVNSKYDFTGKIDANTWNKSSLNIINISGTEIGQIQNSNATHQKNSSEESKKVKSPYLGLCEVETGTDRDTITDTICSRIK